MSISMGQLTEDLEKLQQQFSHYKQEVEKTFISLNARIKKLEEQKKQWCEAASAGGLFTS